jgi:hypothetical protein
VISKTGILTRLEESAGGIPPGNWFKAYGFDEIEVDVLPNRWELDLVFPQNPVYMEEKHSKLTMIP